MYRIEGFKKQDAEIRWKLPDRVFFACGACQVLSFAFLEAHCLPGAQALWLKPAPGFTGNHIFVACEGWIFDYHGYSAREQFLAHTFRKAQRWWPGWQADLVPLPRDVLVSEAKSRTFDGLWLREPGQFLHDAMPRANAFVRRFAGPPGAGDVCRQSGGNSFDVSKPEIHVAFVAQLS